MDDSLQHNAALQLRAVSSDQTTETESETEYVWSDDHNTSERRNVIKFVKLRDD